MTDAQSPSPGPVQRDLASSSPGLPHVQSPERVEAELSSELARHLLAGRKTSDVGQVILAAVTVFVFWEAVPWWMGAGWLALFVAVTAVKAAHRRRLARGVGPSALVPTVRRDVWIGALLWGGWALLMTGADAKDVAMLLIVFAGLIAAATSTLVADRAAFSGFLGIVIGAAALAVTVGGVGRDRLTLLLLIGTFVPFMLVVYRRAHHLLAEQIRAAIRLRMSEEDAARRGDFLDTLLMSAPSPIVVLGAEGTIVRANPAFGRVMGLPWEEASGRRLGSIAKDAGEAGALADFLDSIRAGRRVVRELSLRTMAGHAVWMRISGTTARDLGEPLTILVGEDVTEQVAAREAGELARAEAERATRAKSAFLTTMSHEIRTPMNGILGMTEVLLDTELTKGQRESAEIIRSSGRGLLRILNDVLDVSKMEAGQLDLEIDTLDLLELVTRVVRAFSPAAAEKGLELLLDLGEVPLRVDGDADRVRQILTNLLANAVKFTERGEVVLSVRAEGQGRLRFSVADTGIGIPAEERERIFQEFEQADMSSTRAYGGTGLGLTICRHLVELMGGEITLSSEEGRGSEFTFVLPMPAAAGASSEVESPAVAGGRFLVVDDNATSRRVLGEGLLTLGADEVVEAGDAAAAEEAVRREARFSALVIDQMMPGVGGLELARRLREQSDVEPLPPILLLTSPGGSGSWSEVRSAGIGAYVSKPVSRFGLAEALTGLLERGGRPGPERRGPDRRLAAAEGGRRVRVLLAEDNTVNLHVARAILEKRGYAVRGVENGQEALDAVREQRFDVVLMDVQMPVMDGLEATRRIRALPEGRSLPIVALTAHAFAAERERCEEAGMSDFLAKPFNPEALYEVVERWASGEAAAPESTRRGTSSEDPDTSSGNPVDLEEFRSVMREAGIEEIVDESLEMYLNDTPAMINALSEAVRTGDAHMLHERAHGLKSASGNIRAKDLAALLQRLEDMGREGNVGAARALMERVIAEYRAVITYLEESRSA